jgi:hypothetical protein
MKKTNRSLGLLAAVCAAFSIQPVFAESAAFEFDGAAYYLRGDEAGIREYLTDGETFDDWTTLISIREFSGTDDPKAYANAILANAKESEPDSNGQLLENDAAGSYIADFILFSEEGTEPVFVEWNLWRAERKGDGVEAVQYARRLYKITDTTGQEISDARQEIVPQLAEFVDPASAAQSSSAPVDAPSAGMQTYAYPSEDAPNFTMDVPADWAIESDDKGAWIVSADKQFTTSVVVVDTGDIEDAVNSIKGQIGKRYSEVEWTDLMKQTSPNTGVTFESYDGLAQDKGVKFKVGVHVFSKDGSDKAYILNTWAPEATLMDNAAGIMEMFGTASIK